MCLLLGQFSRSERMPYVTFLLNSAKWSNESILRNTTFDLPDDKFLIMIISGSTSSNIESKCSHFHVRR